MDNEQNDSIGDKYPAVLNLNNFIEVITEMKPPIEYIFSKLTHMQIQHTYYSTGIRAIYGEQIYKKILEMYNEVKEIKK